MRSMSSPDGQAPGWREDRAGPGRGGIRSPSRRLPEVYSEPPARPRARSARPSATLGRAREPEYGQSLGDGMAQRPHLRAARQDPRAQVRHKRDPPATRDNVNVDERCSRSRRKYVLLIMSFPGNRGLEFQTRGHDVAWPERQRLLPSTRLPAATPTVTTTFTKKLATMAFTPPATAANASMARSTRTTAMPFAILTRRGQPVDTSRPIRGVGNRVQSSTRFALIVPGHWMGSPSSYRMRAHPSQERRTPGP